MNTARKNVSLKNRLSPRFVSEAVLKEAWEYADADTQHLTHNIHRYSGKFIPQIASRAIEILTAPGETILDPYCGSGTSLVEAGILGRRAIGVDLNPLATLIARTKITPVPIAELKDLRARMDGWLKQLCVQSQLDLFERSSESAEINAAASNDQRRAEAWFVKWFQPDVLHELLMIDHAIQRVSDGRCRDIARVAFSDILRKSSNAHSGYPNVMFDKNAGKRKRPISPYLAALERITGMVASLEPQKIHWNWLRIEQADNTALNLANCSVDAVITHPPYIGSIPYAEYGALSLKWLGTDPAALDRQLTGGKRQTADVVSRFREGYSKMLSESARVLKLGRYAFIMVGNPVVRAEKIDLAEMTVELAKNAGLQLIVRTTRKGANRRANKMGDEHLLFFQRVAD